MSGLDEALDAAGGPGLVEVDEPGGRTAIDVSDVDRIGVRVRAVRVGHGVRDVAAEADRLTGAVGPLAGPFAPVEVDPRLGGAILRTAPAAIRRGRYDEIGVGTEETSVRRYRLEGGERHPEDLTLTRDQLRDLIDAIRGD